MLFYLRRVYQQLLFADFHRHEGVLIELLVVIVAEPCAEERKVCLADNQVATAFQFLHHLFVGIELTGILHRLVVAQESADVHTVHPLILVDGDVEAAHEEVGEVIACHLKQQLVLVHGVGLVGEDEHKPLVACGTQRVGLRGVCQHRDVSSRPNLTDIKLSAIESAPLLHALDDHTCQFAHLALRIFLHHLLHTFQATVAVAFVQVHHTVDEDELRTVGTQWEPLFREFRVMLHDLCLVGSESLIGGGIERVLDMFAEAGILLEVGVREQDGPFAVREVAL